MKAGTQAITPLKREANIQLKTLQNQAESLLIHDNDSYLVADELRASFKAGYKKFWDRLSEVVDPAYRTYVAARDLRKEVTDPFDKAAVMITAKMRDYKIAEALRLEAERIEREKEAERLRQEAEKKRLAEEKARTAKMAVKLAGQAEVLEAQAEEISSTPIVGVKAENSGVRKIRKIRVVNMMRLLQGIINNEVPDDVVTLDQAALNIYYRGSREDTLKFPGVEEYEEIQIVGKRW